MKKTKIKERFENAVEAFFDNDKLPEETSMTSAQNSAIFQDVSEESFSTKSKNLKNILKQIFIFFPGTFILFGLSMMLVYVSIIHPYNTVRLEKPIQLLFILTTTFFMTWLGLGNIRKLKEIAIPMSVVGIGALIGAISGIASIIDLSLIHKILSDSGYPLYFLPFGLIAPLITKMWIEKSYNEKKDI